MHSIDSLFGDAVSVRDHSVTINTESALASDTMDQLARHAVFGGEHERNYGRWLIWEIGQAVGVRAASIHDLYMARGRGEIGGVTVPAINVRGMSYDTARAIFRTANKLNAGAFILENLDLRDVSAGQYDLVALPLKLEGMDAAPVRAALRPYPHT